ncbi:hypothetical protein HCB17_26400 [Salinispora arenicola]|nr:hypothetical protein [Salinispora arenicola]NIL44232.1 hypothetical protein [Salinispora arenicola]
MVEVECSAGVDQDCSAVAVGLSAGDFEVVEGEVAAGADGDDAELLHPGGACDGGVFAAVEGDGGGDGG